MITKQRRKTNADYYRGHKVQHKAHSVAAQKRYNEMIWALKCAPCTDCGNLYHPAVMEFDHVSERGLKLFNIGGRVRPIKDLNLELSKCDLVCANCHSLREWERRQV